MSLTRRLRNSACAVASKYRVGQGSRIKEAGNAITEVMGEREIQPVNLTARPAARAYAVAAGRPVVDRKDRMGVPDATGSHPRVRVIALGQPAAGDDGAGPAVLEALRRRGVPEGVELVRSADATALMSLLETPAPVVVVDAALAEPPGEVLVLDPGELAERGVQPVSSHGMGVGEVIALARTLSPDQVSPSILVVAVTIARPDRYREGLSPAVAAAADRAVDTILELVRRDTES